MAQPNGEDPINIYTKKDHMFGVTCGNTAANSNTMNNFGGSGSMFASSNQISASFINGDTSINKSMTNYETALEWGRLGHSLQDA